MRMWKIYILVGMLCLTSCSKYPEVKECVQKYLEEMANHDSISINDNLLIKPGDSPKTMNDYKCYNYSDYKITNIISRGDSLFKVAVELISPKREIALLVEKDTIKNENSYSVIDSWNFLDFEYSEKDYEFAKKTGCLPDSCFTDLEIENRVNTSFLMRFEYMTELEQNLKSKIKVQNQNWDKGYGNYASGSAIIYNGSSYSFFSLGFIRPSLIHLLTDAWVVFIHLAK